MKLYYGKWYLIVKIGDLGVGFGKGDLPESITSTIDKSRPHRGV